MSYADPFCLIFFNFSPFKTNSFEMIIFTIPSFFNSGKSNITGNKIFSKVDRKLRAPLFFLAEILEISFNADRSKERLMPSIENNF